MYQTPPTRCHRMAASLLRSAVRVRPRKTPAAYQEQAIGDRYHGAGRTLDDDERRQSEMVGSRSAAVKVVEKRRTQAREGIKMPENLRAKSTSFSEVAERALAYSKANKRSYSHDKQRMEHLKEEFGNRLAEDISRGEIQKWLTAKPRIGQSQLATAIWPC